MPFLVDSVTAALTRLGRGIHSVAHPRLAAPRRRRRPPRPGPSRLGGGAGHRRGLDPRRGRPAGGPGGPSHPGHRAHRRARGRARGGPRLGSHPSCSRSSRSSTSPRRRRTRHSLPATWPRPGSSSRSGTASTACSRRSPPSGARTAGRPSHGLRSATTSTPCTANSPRPYSATLGARRLPGPARPSMPRSRGGRMHTRRQYDALGRPWRTWRRPGEPISSHSRWRCAACGRFSADADLAPPDRAPGNSPAEPVRR